MCLNCFVNQMSASIPCFYSSLTFIDSLILSKCLLFLIITSSAFFASFHRTKRAKSCIRRPLNRRCLVCYKLRSPSRPLTLALDFVKVAAEELRSRTQQEGFSTSPLPALKAAVADCFGEFSTRIA